MTRDDDRHPSELERPEGNDLQSNYEAHDVGEEYLMGRLRAMGYDVTDWGIDHRENTEELEYDDKMDMKVWDGDDLVALIDVKTKRNPDWFGIFNERHAAHYYTWAERLELPTFVFMVLLTDNNHIQRDAFIHLQDHKNADRRYFEEGNEEWPSVTPRNCEDVYSRFRAPDGNMVVEMDDDVYGSWPYFQQVIR